MMMPLVFDTLKYTKTLEESGMPRVQAEAQARANREALSEALREAVHDEVATKRDISDVRKEIESVRTEIQTSKNDVLKWMFGGFIAVLGLLAAIMMRLPA